MIITIDTGGTKTLIAGFYNNGEIAKSFQFPTPKNTKKYLEIIENIIKKEFSTELKDKKIQAISIAAPGIIHDGVINWAQNLGWKKFNLQSELTEVFPDLPIFIDNDANLAGLSESLNLKEDLVLYTTFSTGIGSGIITNHQINEGLKDSEIGRIPIEYDGRIREWESFASARAIFNTYGKYFQDITHPKQLLNIADRLSRGFLVIIPIIQPEVIVVGGSLGDNFQKIEAYLIHLLRENLPPHIPCPKIIKAKRPKEAVIYGCYELAKAKLIQK